MCAASHRAALCGRRAREHISTEGAQGERNSRTRFGALLLAPWEAPCCPWLTLDSACSAASHSAAAMPACASVSQASASASPVNTGDSSTSASIAGMGRLGCDDCELVMRAEDIGEGEREAAGCRCRQAGRLPTRHALHTRWTSTDAGTSAGLACAALGAAGLLLGRRRRALAQLLRIRHQAFRQPERRRLRQPSAHAKLLAPARTPQQSHPPSPS